MTIKKGSPRSRNAGSHPIPSLEDASLFQDYLDSVTNETRVKRKKEKMASKDRSSIPDRDQIITIVNDPDTSDRPSGKPGFIQKPSGFTTGVRPIPGKPAVRPTGKPGFIQKPSSTGTTTGVRPIPKPGIGRPVMDDPVVNVLPGEVSWPGTGGSVMDDPVVNVQPGEVSWPGTGGAVTDGPSDEWWFRRGKFDIRNPNQYLQSLNPNNYGF